MYDKHSIKNQQYFGTERKNIKNVSFPKTLKKIGRQAFYGCNIEILSLPQNLEYIDEKAFAQNQSLFTISFNEGIKVIQDLAFEVCTSLPYVIIPKRTDCIYTSIFNNCASLSTISFEGDIGRLQSTDAGFASGLGLPHRLYLWQFYEGLCG